MPARNFDLHGSVPDSSSVVLLLIDVINDLDFSHADKLLKHAVPMARAIQELKRKAKAAGIPTVYVNDNFGRWQSDLSHIIEHCACGKGKGIVEMLRPEDDDYFVLKPKHSGFYSTTLDTLLRYFGANTLILTGMAGNICILFTANDAYMRDYQLVVPSDCVASNSEDDNRFALQQMEKFLKADVTPSDRLDLNALKSRAASIDKIES